MNKLNAIIAGLIVSGLITAAPVAIELTFQNRPSPTVVEPVHSTPANLQPAISAESYQPASVTLQGGAR